MPKQERSPHASTLRERGLVDCETFDIFKAVNGYKSLISGIVDLQYSRQEANTSSTCRDFRD